jgi:sulfide:quinone oxidoreductase
MGANRFKVLILGGGTAGITVASRLVNKLGSGQVGVVEPSEFHFYQPAWTLVGGGVYKKEKTRKSEQEQIPAGVTWVRDAVQRVFPKENRVRLSSGKEVFYDYLVVATGLRLNWESIKGLEGHLGRDGIGTIYEYDQCDRVRDMLYAFKGGTAIFVMPPVPIKCAGAPQKIMYLADEIFREQGVREKSKMIFASAGKAIFGVPEFAKPLNEVVKRKGIETRFSRRLIEVRPEQKIAVFEHLI